MSRIDIFILLKFQTKYYEPIPQPEITDLLSRSDSSATSPKPKLTPWPARGCTLCAASLRQIHKFI